MLKVLISMSYKCHTNFSQPKILLKLLSLTWHLQQALESSTLHCLLVQQKYNAYEMRIQFNSVQNLLYDMMELYRPDSHPPETDKNLAEVKKAAFSENNVWCSLAHKCAKEPKKLLCQHNGLSPVEETTGWERWLKNQRVVGELQTGVGMQWRPVVQTVLNLSTCARLSWQIGFVDKPAEGIAVARAELNQHNYSIAIYTVKNDKLDLESFSLSLSLSLSLYSSTFTLRRNSTDCCLCFPAVRPAQLLIAGVSSRRPNFDFHKKYYASYVCMRPTARVQNRISSLYLAILPTWLLLACASTTGSLAAR